MSVPFFLLSVPVIQFSPQVLPGVTACLCLLSKVPGRIHVLVQDTDDRDAVILDTKVDEMPTGGAAPVAGANVPAIRASIGAWANAVQRSTSSCV